MDAGQGPVKKGQNILLVVWGMALAVVVPLLLIQTSQGKYADPGKVWAWFTFAFAPIIGTLAGGTWGSWSARQAGMVSSGAFACAAIISIVYVLAVVLILLLEPLVQGSADEWLEQSRLPLGALAGLAAASLGVFFASSEREHPDEHDQPGT